MAFHINLIFVVVLDFSIGWIWALDLWSIESNVFVIYILVCAECMHVACCTRVCVCLCCLDVRACVRLYLKIKPH